MLDNLKTLRMISGGMILGVCTIGLTGCDEIAAMSNAGEPVEVHIGEPIVEAGHEPLENFKSLELQKRNASGDIVMSWPAELTDRGYNVYFTRDGQAPLPNPDRISSFGGGAIEPREVIEAAPRAANSTVSVCPLETGYIPYYFMIAVPSDKMSRGSISLNVEQDFWNLWPDQEAQREAIVKRLQDLQGYHICTDHGDGQSCLELPVASLSVEDIGFDCW